MPPKPHSISRPAISVPVAVAIPQFQPQLELFAFAHQRLYGQARLHAIVIERNHRHQPPQKALHWPVSCPYTLTRGICDARPERSWPAVAMPVNIQVGLSQIIDQFPDDQTLELCDCDMLHFRPSPVGAVPHHELHVCTIYEHWHLFSTSSHRFVIAPYLNHHGDLTFANGGFVPIIGTAHTFRRLLTDWTDIHLDILNHAYGELIHWWAGMYALQAAAERNQIKMIAKNHTYLPGVNELEPEHYIGHYAVDTALDKHRWLTDKPNPHHLPDNAFYNVVRDYLLTGA